MAIPGEGVRVEEGEVGSRSGAGLQSDLLKKGRREASESVERDISLFRKLVSSSDGLLLNLEADSLWEGVACMDSPYHWMAMRHLCQKLYQVQCVCVCVCVCLPVCLSVHVCVCVC